MTDILIWIIGTVAAVSGVVLGRFWGRIEGERTGKRTGKQEAERDAMEETIGRVERGRTAVRDGRSAGSPADRLRDNDGAW